MNRRTLFHCEGCGRPAKVATLACRRCLSSIPRTLLVDVKLAGHLNPSSDYWKKTAAAVRNSLALYWSRVHPSGRRDARPLKRRKLPGLLIWVKDARGWHPSTLTRRA